MTPIVEQRLKKYLSEYEYLKDELQLTEIQFFEYNRSFKQDFCEEIHHAGANQKLKCAAIEKPCNNPKTSATVIDPVFQLNSSEKINHTLDMYRRQNSSNIDDPHDHGHGHLEDGTDDFSLHSDASAKNLNLLIKKLFQKLILICHPDKQSDPRIIELYPKVENAYRKRHLLALLNLSKMMRIDDIDNVLLQSPDFPLDVFAWMQECVDELRKQIEMIKNTFAWVWGTSDNDIKPTIRANFIRTFSA